MRYLLPSIPKAQREILLRIEAVSLGTSFIPWPWWLNWARRLLRIGAMTTPWGIFFDEQIDAHLEVRAHELQHHRQGRGGWCKFALRYYLLPSARRAYEIEAEAHETLMRLRLRNLLVDDPLHVEACISAKALRTGGLPYCLSPKPGEVVRGICTEVARISEELA